MQYIKDRIVEYKIVRAGGFDALEKLVNKMLKEKWEVVGSVSLSRLKSPNGYFWAIQAMQRKVKK